MANPTSPLALFPDVCPCCGYDTIDARAEYNICRICWWEDDGQDNHNANAIHGGPNSIVSFARARLNFLTEGIFDPSRSDLQARRVPSRSYIAKRHFVFDPQTSSISEPATGWTTTLAELDDDPDHSFYSIGDSVIYRRRRLDKEPKLGAIASIEWDDKLWTWRYRLNDDCGRQVQHSFYGPDLRPG